jgi:coenzyme F420-0:L-glutamate ligase/coenzyme F420-1:gamma-L-glutamate ligase
MDRGTIITETHQGFICANAGVDKSNVPGADTVTLLPTDPDGSARRLFDRIKEATGYAIPIIISDTWGRPWREGIVNFAIGVAGLKPIVDYRGHRDPFGNELRVTQVAVADELAAAAELVTGKLDRVPAAIVRGYPWQAGPGTARELLRDPSRDLFR